MPEDGNKAGFRNIVLLHKLDDGQFPKQKIMPVKFGRVLRSVSDFLTLEDGTDRFSENVGKELPHNTA